MSQFQLLRCSLCPAMIMIWGMRFVKLCFLHFLQYFSSFGTGVAVLRFVVKYAPWTQGLCHHFVFFIFFPALHLLLMLSLSLAADL